MYSLVCSYVVKKFQICQENLYPFFKMKLLLKFSFLSFLFFTACNNDFNPVSGYKDIPVVYGFLSPTDTATYIRVEKAFADPVKSPNNIAQIPDSLYYKDVTVTLVRTKDNARFVLKQVDGNKEGYPRQNGVFATSPNYLYKISNKILAPQADDAFRIELQHATDTKPFAQATTKIVGTYTFFIQNNVQTWTYTSGGIFRVDTDEKSARTYDLKLIFNYDESDPTKPGSTVSQNVVWDYISNQTRNIGADGIPDPEIRFVHSNPQDFYVFLQTNIAEKSGIVRTFKSIDLILYAGGSEFINYETNGIANIGITGSQSIPVYTNIINGLGLFSSRSTAVYKGLTLSDASLELLKNGDFTKKLNFK